MRRALRQKFAEDAEIREKLLATGNEEWVEKASKDYYWGCGATGTGKNRLGVLLMVARAELRGDPKPEASAAPQAAQTAFDLNES